MLPNDSATSRTDPIIRPIEPRDDPMVERLIVETLTEFACTDDGFALHDAEVQAMSAHYTTATRRFYVVEHADQVCGCGGFAPLDGISEEQRIGELRKMYFRPTLRGRGVGRALLNLILQEMAAAGFARCYLETTTRMGSARRLYQRMGFAELAAPLGATGHGGCDRFYSKGL